MLYLFIRLDLTLTGIKAAVAHIASRSIPTQQQLLCFIWGRISRTNIRFERLYARWLTGTLPPLRAPRARKSRAPRPKPEICIPHKKGWLLQILRITNANAYGGQIESLVNNPQTTAFRAAVPRADRLLRPLCHMLGVTLPALTPVPTPTCRVGAGPPRQTRSEAEWRQLSRRENVADAAGGKRCPPPILSSA